MDVDQQADETGTAHAKPKIVAFHTRGPVDEKNR